MKAKHSLVVGVSGSGKTTLLREMHENFNGVSIFVNFEINDDRAEDIAGYRARGRKAMATAVGKFDEWSDVKINLLGDDPMGMVELATDFAVDVWDTAGVPVQIIMDECHHLIGDAADISENRALWVLAEGRDKGIKGVFATQNPQKLDYTELLNVPYWAFVGQPATVQKGFFDHWGIDMDDLPDEPHEYQVKDRQMKTLYSGQTQEEYA